jgi:branched-chain amino acid transport system substrate-binding protein
VNRCTAAAASVAVLALGFGGCGGGGGGGVNGETVTAYVSLPLRGPEALAGEGAANGVKLALGRAGGRVGGLRVRAIYLDDTRGGRWSLARSGANARRASEDSAAIGYIGDLDSGATRASLPITNQAGMVQISPGSTAIDLTRLPPVGGAGPDRYRPSGDQTFARVVPDDDVQARAAALWAMRVGAKRVASLSDGSDVGRGMALEFRQAASVLGLGVGGPADADLVYYGGTAEGLAAALRDAGRVPVIGSEALLGPAVERPAAGIAGRIQVTSSFLAPSLLPAKGQGFVRAYRKRFRRPPDPAASYGYEAMSLLLDAIRRAGDGGDDRGAVVDEVLSTTDRHSVLGSYSIDGNGDTTLDTVSGYRVSDGVPVFPVRLKPPR